MRSTLILLGFLLVTLNSFSNDQLEKGKDAIVNSNFSEANEILSNLISKCTDCSDSIIAEAYIYNGKSHQLLEKHDLAYSDYRKGLELFEDIKNHNGQVLALVSLAEFYRNLSQFEVSIKYLNKAEDVVLNHPVSIKQRIYYYNRFAAIHNEIGDEAAKVIKYSEKVIVLARKLGDLYLEANSYNELGFLYENKRDPKAEEYYNKAYVLFEQLEDKLSMAHVIRNIARMYYMFMNIENHHVKALETANKGLKLVDTTDWISIKQSLYKTKYESLIALKRFEEATIAGLNLSNLRFQELEQQSSKSLFEIETKYAVKEKDNQILLEQKKRQLLDTENKSKESKLKYSLLISFLLAAMFIGVLFFTLRMKRKNATLRKTIGQKEILIQEVHHRVKNNLTILNSLLYLRSKASDDKNVKTILAECQTRVHSMALVHQNLYDVEDASRVDLNKFVNQLISESASIFSFSNKKIHSSVKTNNISFDMGFTIFLGLILNELITNSFKYAFKDEKSNTIQIEFNKLDESSFELTYSDSGLGLADDIISSSEGFGFRLIRIMLNQINGEINYDSQINKFIIQFKSGKKS